jgi:hypothetical protein
MDKSQASHGEPPVQLMVHADLGVRIAGVHKQHDRARGGEYLIQEFQLLGRQSAYHSAHLGEMPRG